MNINIDYSQNAVAQAIDEMIATSNVIHLDSSDFGDLLAANGEVFVACAEACCLREGYFSELCCALTEKVRESCGNHAPNNIVLFVSQPRHTPLLVEDMNNIQEMIDDITCDTTAVTWGLGTNEGNSVRISVLCNIKKQGAQR